MYMLTAFNNFLMTPTLTSIPNFLWESLLGDSDGDPWFAFKGQAEPVWSINCYRELLLTLPNPIK